MKRWTVIDFETASARDLKRAGAWRYAEDLSTEILCLAYSGANGVGVISLWGSSLQYDPSRVERAGSLESYVADPELVFVAHNAMFEKAIWRRIMVDQYGWPDIPNSRWHDSMAVCAMRVIPMDLDHACIIMKLPQQKDKEGSTLVKSLSKFDRKGNFPARTPEIMRRVRDYNAQDIRSQVSLHERIGWLPPGERSVWLLDQRINERGVRLDLPFVRAAKKIVDDASKPLLAEFQGITGGLKLSSPKFTKWVQDKGVDIPNMQKATVAKILGEDVDDAEDDDEDVDIGPLPPDVKRALSIRQLIGSASVKKLKAMEACVCVDGRVHGALQYHGAGPGRWAGRLFQPQNFPRGSIKVDGEAPDPGPLVAAVMSEDWRYVEMLYGPAVETIVSSLRHSIIPNPGRLLCAGDYASIEARIVLALAGQHDKCELLASGADVYIDMACDIFDMPKPAPDDKAAIKAFKAQHPEERTVGKNTVLGCGFQMGAKKFHSRYCSEKPMQFAQDAIDTYRQVWAPKVPLVWEALGEAALRTVIDKVPHESYGVLYQLEDRWLTARLPSGRKLWYFNPQPCRRLMPWSTPDQPDVRLAWTYQAKKMGRWVTIDAYGGLLTENVVQALARDLLCTAAFKAEKENFPICLTVHDELITEPEEVRAEYKVLEQIMCDRPQWAIDMMIPVQASCWTGERYKK